MLRKRAPRAALLLAALLALGPVAPSSSSAFASASAWPAPELDVDDHRESRSHDDDDEPPCDASFPLAPRGELDGLLARRRLRGGRPVAATADREIYLAVPSDPTRRAHAPLCALPSAARGDSNGDPNGDPRPRLDVRRLQNCPASQCYVAAYQSCFHTTSWECKNPPPPAPPPPTPKPSVATIETVHPVQVKLRGVPEDYRPSPEVRATVLRFVTEALRDGLDDGLVFVSAEYAGRLKEKAVVPVAVTVRGPADVSNYALFYIMQVIRERFDELVAALQQTGDVFGDLSLGSGTFDFADILTGETRPPTFEPTPMPVKKTIDGESDENAMNFEINDSSQVIVEESKGTPWWVWAIVVLLLLALLLCAVAYCCYRRRRQREGDPKKKGNKHPSKKEQDQQRAMNLWKRGEAGNGDKGRPNPWSSAPPNGTAGRGGRTKSKQAQSAPARPVRPGIKRMISQTEIAEEERERATNGADPLMGLHQMHTQRNLDASGRTSDPPEENARVPYSKRERKKRDKAKDGRRDRGGRRPCDERRSDEEEPEGSKIPIKQSMYAAEAVRARPGAEEEWEEPASRAEEPDGAIDRKKSMFAAEAVEKERSARKGREEQRRRRSKRKSGKRRSAAAALRASFAGGSGGAKEKKVPIDPDEESGGAPRDALVVYDAPNPPDPDEEVAPSSEPDAMGRTGEETLDEPRESRRRSRSGGNQEPQAKRKSGKRGGRQQEGMFKSFSKRMSWNVPDPDDDDDSAPETDEEGGAGNRRRDERRGIGGGKKERTRSKKSGGEGGSSKRPSSAKRGGRQEGMFKSFSKRISWGADGDDDDDLATREPEAPDDAGRLEAEEEGQAADDRDARRGEGGGKKERTRSKKGAKGNSKASSGTRKKDRKKEIILQSFSKRVSWGVSGDDQSLGSLE